MHTQGETINIEGAENEYVGSLTVGADVYFYESRNFRRFEDKTVNGTITRLVSSTDNSVAVTSIVAPSIFQIDTSIRGNEMPVIQFDGTWDRAYTSARYRYKVIDSSTKQVVENTVDVPMTELATGFSIQTLPLNVVAQMRTDAKLPTGYNNLIVFDYRIEFRAYFHVSSPNPVYDHEYSIHYNNRHNLVMDEGQENPFAYGEKYIQGLSGPAVVNHDFNFLDWLENAFGFFEVELFGDFTIGGLLSVVLSISLVIAFLKIFAGG